MTTHPPGTFCWVDLGTTDAAAAKRFYTQLFGWSFDDRPAGPDAVYTMFNVRGKDVAALYDQPEDQREQGVPPNWLSYVSVPHVDEAAKKAKSLGATLISEPFDVLDVGRMALVQDPTGAVFALWEPRRHTGAKLVNEPVSLSWNELATRDVPRARKFYTELFGWTAQTQDMGNMDYTTFRNGERAAGGLMEIAKEWGPVPPHWAPYFAVEDCDRTVEKAKGLGASVLMPPTDIPETGRFAALKDPQGAVFNVIRLINPD
jgi:predicted enzyme related to lactoylglutathione lyase